MTAQHPTAAPRSRAHRPAVFSTAAGIRPGTVVFDRTYDMPGTVREVDGAFVVLDRPTGMTWRAHYRHLRRATDWERRQLPALARLHAQRLRGTDSPGPGALGREG
ncbi:hypothetical protein [Streptomyces sp. AN091965]|uniref:hypothetical protein n=1 Tax=Streptomyces sp. AN091965 TaxID=2927803 RepID=UPI001F60F9AD|nr:hypothetical protein [Streptomyces sp. AN091965]MCI3933133.1 hypothetical protein [Streptomyces sp. AN091965]